VLPEERIDVLAALLWRFETVPSVRDLMAVLLEGYRH
jgi:hypothetical protein